MHRRRRRATHRPEPSTRRVARGEKVAFARDQRAHATRGEKALWEALRARRLGVRFRRQHPIGHFVLDFYCAEARLAVEVDGPVHAADAGYDRWRDEQLALQGVQTLRFREDEVLQRTSEVLAKIREALM